MLDKRLPYYNILMRADWRTVKAATPHPLPSGYRYRTYSRGDMNAWAMLEASVGEFDTAEAAREAFAARYLPHESDLATRCWFIVDAQGAPCATAMAWYYNERGQHWASLHWVSVSPDHQRKGLGQAITSRAMATFPSVEPGEDVYLHTQTWSYPAIGIYLSQGFYPLIAETFAHHQNDFRQAAAVLKPYLRPAQYSMFLSAAR